MIYEFVIGLVFSIIAVTVVKEIIVYKSLDFYRRQNGVKVHYFPILGLYKLFIKDNGSNDRLKRLSDFYSQSRDQKMIVSSLSSFPFSPIVIPIDRKLTKEMFSREQSLLAKKGDIFLKLSKSFFVESGYHAIEKRKIFSALFKNENMEKMEPEIKKIFCDNFDKLKLNEWTKVNFSNFLETCMSCIVDRFVMGSEEKILIEGKNLAAYLLSEKMAYRKSRDSIINILSWSLLSKSKWLPLNWEAKRLTEKLVDKAL